MTLSPCTARRLGIWVPAACAVVAETVRQTVLVRFLPPFSISMLAVVVTLVLAWLFSSGVFHELTRSFSEQERLRTELNRLLAEEQRAKELSDTFYAISCDLTSIMDMDRNLPVVLGRVRTLFGADIIGLALKDTESGNLHVKKHLPCSVCPEGSCRQVLSLAESAMSSGSPQQFPPLGVPDPRATDLGACGLSAAQVVPLRARGEWFGALVVGYRSVHRITADEVTLLARVADGAALAFENVYLYASVEGMAALKERQRLARELHDSLAQSVAFIRGRVRDVVDLLAEPCLEEAQRMLGQVLAHVDSAEQDVREAIWELKSSGKAQGDFLSALREHLQEFSRNTGIATELDVPEGLRGRMPLHVEIQLVRVVQEALANVRKHARASRVRVSLQQGNGPFTLTLVDNGRGFEPALVAKRHHYGIQTMKERVATFGGSLTVESRLGHGTRVLISIPVSLISDGEKEDGRHANFAG